MTTRDQVRRAVRADRGETRAIPAEPTPGLPERLLAARERKGVDLYRAERDTKIRVRYLAALERGDYRELPGASTRRASCATTRCTSASIRTTSSSSGVASGETRASRRRSSPCRGPSPRRARA